MSDLGVAVRVHSREEAARIWYRMYRNFYISNRRASNWIAPIRGALIRDLVHVMAARACWSALREIIDAEERREVRAAVEQPCLNHDPNTGPGSDYCVACGRYERVPA